MSRRIASADAPTDPRVAAPSGVTAFSPPSAGGPLLPVVGDDLRAPLVSGRSIRYANLDVAASAPALHSVAARVADVLPVYASVHRGAGYASQVSTGLYESARASVGRFLGARSDDVVVFTRNTTDAINLLSGCIAGTGDVIVLDIEHHANLLPWQRLGHRVVAAEATWAQTRDALERALRARPTALLAVTGSSNVTGETIPLDDVAGLAHANGARVLVDGAQLAPHRRIDLSATDVDYLAVSGHKLYAPFGSGLLVGRRDWLDAAPAYLAGGGAVVEVGLHDTRWASSPERHEAGTPNVLGAVAIAAACEALEGLPVGALEAHESRLHRRLLDGLGDLPEVSVVRLWPDSADRIGVVTFQVDGYPPDLVASVLSAEYGIGVRDGRFCAHPLLQRLGHGAGAVRASVGVGSRDEDVDRLVEALTVLIADGPAWTYGRPDGRSIPVPDPRPPDPWGGSDVTAAQGRPACQPA